MAFGGHDHRAHGGEDQQSHMRTFSRRAAPARVRRRRSAAYLSQWSARGSRRCESPVPPPGGSRRAHSEGRTARSGVGWAPRSGRVPSARPRPRPCSRPRAGIQEPPGFHFLVYLCTCLLVYFSIFASAGLVEVIFRRTIIRLCDIPIASPRSCVRKKTGICNSSPMTREALSW